MTALCPFGTIRATFESVVVQLTVAGTRGGPTVATVAVKVVDAEVPSNTALSGLRTIPVTCAFGSLGGGGVTPSPPPQPESASNEHETRPASRATIALMRAPTNASGCKRVASESE
jgi:hypothetical protein